MQKTQNLQDSFLNQLRKDKSVVTMFLMNAERTSPSSRCF